MKTDNHATSEIASGSKLGIDATKKIPGEGFQTPLAAADQNDEAVKAKVEKLFKPWPPTRAGCKLKGMKARKKIAQGKRSETSAALGQRTK
ncbi:MAG: hypothetical protein HY735_29560 [Verrucomicrobia bacterium]|nr:hypothetical protein [Verrucomicrobiota bacterium]